MALQERHEQAEETKDRRAAIIAVTIAQCLAKGKHKIEDFMPRKRKVKQAAQDMIAVAKNITESYHGNR